MASLVLTILGDDRPGLVSAVSAPISAHGASWERSEMSRLAGKFAGIVVVSVPAERLDALVAELDRAREPGAAGDRRTDRRAGPAPLPTTHASTCSAPTGRASCPRSPPSLADAHVSIEELSTDVRDAPMAGGTLFEARALLSAPLGGDTDALREVLEALADELMVEIRLSD